MPPHPHDSRPTPVISMKGAIWYLAHDVGPEGAAPLERTPRWEVRARLRIEDEILICVGTYYSGGMTIHTGPKARFLRGQEGTTAAAHAVGAEYEWLPAPEGS